MDFARQQRDPTKHMIGIACVILLHVLVIYALVTGLGSKVMQVIKKPLSATIVEEIKVPPPPPPPPKKVEIPKAPPPPQQPYVPPPDVPVPVTPAEPVIAAVTPTPPPTPPVIAPPPPPAPPPPAPKPTLVRNPTPLGDCAPDMPAEARRKNIEGTVHAQMMINDKGNVTEVKIIESSNKVFDRGVVNALSQCKFRPSGDAYIGDIEVEFKLQ